MIQKASLSASAVTVDRKANNPKLFMSQPNNQTWETDWVPLHVPDPLLDLEPESLPDYQRTSPSIRIPQGTTQTPKP
jgi:hypothetical protein